MFELKYFATIDRYEREERNDTDPLPLPPFDIDVLGTDGLFKRASRRLTRWFFLFAFWGAYFVYVLVRFRAGRQPKAMYEGAKVTPRACVGTCDIRSADGNCKTS